VTRIAALAASLLLLASSVASSLQVDAYQDRRIETGVRLFPALLAADLNLEQKAQADGRLLVLFFYTDDRKRADELAAAFRDLVAAKPLRGRAVLVESTSDPTFAAHAGRAPAGVFLAQSPDAAGLRSIVQFGIAHHVIVYSPFEGHVERGVLGGLAVEAQIRPYINQTTLSASNISLKEFFLRATKVYR
jgi:hypothetical protein